MKPVLALLLVALVALSAGATDLGGRAPAKPAATHLAPPPDPAVVRQGGDTIADAVAVTIPYVGSGTTTGYTDDYEESCPYSSTSPDVVYTFTADADVYLDIDLCDSSYDTKVFVYDADLALVACNDDYYLDPDDPCGLYVSKLEFMPVQAGVQYFVVVDGYAGDHGDYLVEITAHVPCELECPAGAELEGEPPLVDDYVDEFNGGCGSPSGHAFSTFVGTVFCGTSGWYDSWGSNGRDTDWFELVIPPGGVLEITGDAEYATHLFHLGPTDCESVMVLDQVTVGPCDPGVLAIEGTPWEVIWFWVGPTVFDGPVNEYAYVLHANYAIATEGRSWSAVKGLFR